MYTDPRRLMVNNRTLREFSKNSGISTFVMNNGFSLKNYRKTKFAMREWIKEKH